MPRKAVVERFLAFADRLTECGSSEVDDSNFCKAGLRRKLNTTAT